jgi:hypothetical protein
LIRPPASPCSEVGDTSCTRNRRRESRAAAAEAHGEKSRGARLADRFGIKALLLAANGITLLFGAWNGGEVLILGGSMRVSPKSARKMATVNGGF